MEIANVKAMDLDPLSIETLRNFPWLDILWDEGASNQHICSQDTQLHQFCNYAKSETTLLMQKSCESNTVKKTTSLCPCCSYPMQTYS